MINGTDVIYARVFLYLISKLKAVTFTMCLHIVSIYEENIARNTSFKSHYLQHIPWDTLCKTIHETETGIAQPLFIKCVHYCQSEHMLHLYTHMECRNLPSALKRFPFHTHCMIYLGQMIEMDCSNIFVWINVNLFLLSKHSSCKPNTI